MSKVNCSIVISLFSIVYSNGLIVTLPDGKIRGTTHRSPSNILYSGFHGIPFAKPPVGQLRFEAPRPNKKWKGILDATRDRKSCVSEDHELLRDKEDEDCLYINVYTPCLKPEEKLVVLVWIYGGSYTSGSSSMHIYNPDFFIEENVIIVSFNYRLGPFGFLSTGDDQIHGNAGLKDQLLALKWVKKNVKLFGGDPEKITVFGESAGGSSIGLQILNKETEGLYRAAIMESGAALHNWTADPDPLKFTKLLVSQLSSDVNLSDTKEMKEFLKSQSVDDIQAAALTLTDQSWPVIEVDSDDAFITKSHYELLASGEFVQVPIIIGLCSEESLYFLQTKENTQLLALDYDSTPELLVPDNLNANSSDLMTVTSKIRSIYLNESEHFIDNLAAVAEFYSDEFFGRSVLKHAELASSFVPVYFYQFAYYGGRLLSTAFIEGAEKVGHASEIPYLFNIIPLSSQAPDDVQTQLRIVKLWSNFAKYLDPTPEQSELFDNVTWPVYDAESKNYLNINVSLKVESKLKADVMRKWDEIFESYGEKPFIVY